MLRGDKPTVASPIPQSQECSLGDVSRHCTPLARNPPLAAAESFQQQEEIYQYKLQQPHCVRLPRKGRQLAERITYHQTPPTESVPSRTSEVHFGADAVTPPNFRLLGDTSPLSSSQDLMEFQNQASEHTQPCLSAAEEANWRPQGGGLANTRADFHGEKHLRHGSGEVNDESALKEADGGFQRRSAAQHSRSRIQILGHLMRVCLQLVFLLFREAHEVTSVCLWQMLGWGLGVFRCLCCRCSVCLHLLVSGVSREDGQGSRPLACAYESFAKLLRLAGSLIERSEAAAASGQCRAVYEMLSARTAAVQTAANVGCMCTAVMRHLKAFCCTTVAASARQQMQLTTAKQKVDDEGNLALSSEEALATACDLWASLHRVSPTKRVSVAQFQQLLRQRLVPRDGILYLIPDRYPIELDPHQMPSGEVKTATQQQEEQLQQSDEVPHHFPAAYTRRSDSVPRWKPVAIAIDALHSACRLCTKVLQALLRQTQQRQQQHKQQQQQQQQEKSMQRGRHSLLWSIPVEAMAAAFLLSKRILRACGVASSAIIGFCLSSCRRLLLLLSTLCGEVAAIVGLNVKRNTLLLGDGPLCGVWAAAQGLGRARR